MREGWCGEDYLILFDASEVPKASVRYDIARSLPGYVILGLRGWDDFIVRDQAGLVYTVPTVPLSLDCLETFQVPEGLIKLQHDPRVTGRIKWYVQPLCFGGDPELGENLSWVNHEQHSQLVQWWNNMYRELASGMPEA